MFKAYWLTIFDGRLARVASTPLQIPLLSVLRKHIRAPLCEERFFDQKDFFPALLTLQIRFGTIGYLVSIYHFKKCEVHFDRNRRSDLYKWKEAQLLCTGCFL